jgi:hypothetical protein
VTSARPLSPRALAATVFAFALLLRGPFLDAGFGWDSDAWRVAGSAAAMAESGRPTLSRIRGNPLPEFAAALAWAAAHATGLVRRDLDLAPLLNGLTAVVGALGAAAFALLLCRLRLPGALLGGLAFASVPAFLAVSTSTLDYAWGLSFGVAALLAAQAGRPAACAIALGLSIGSRLTGVLFLPPALLLLAGSLPAAHPARALRLAGTAAGALALGAAFFVPGFLDLGWSLFGYYDIGNPAWSLVVKKATVDLWGWPGAMAVGGAAIAAGVVGARAVARGQAPDRIVLAAGLGLLLFSLAYLRLPYKAAYLLPAVPFAWILLARALPARALAVVATLVMVSPWLLAVYEPGKTDDPAPAAARWEVRIGGRRFAVDLHGPILLDRSRRLEGLRVGRWIELQVRNGLPPSVFVVHDWLPQLRVRLEDYRGPVEWRDVRLVHHLTAEAWDRARSEGRPLFYLAGSEEHRAVRFGLDPATLHGQPVRIPAALP